MLDLNPDTVFFIINKAHEFQSPEPDDSDATADPNAFGDTAVRPAVSDPIHEELRATIDDLEPDQQISLVSLMWLGRGDYSLDEWSDALAHARDSWNEHTADYLIGTPMLADYLSEGLEQFGHTED